MELIDKSALIADIKRRIKEIDEIGTYLSPKGVLTNLLCHINTLEVKEVDLEKEIKDWWNAYYSSKDYTFEGHTGHYIENFTLIEIAKHFYELGLTAQKGENV